MSKLVLNELRINAGLDQMCRVRPAHRVKIESRSQSKLLAVARESLSYTIYRHERASFAGE